MIEHDIRHPFEAAVPRDGNRRQRQRMINEGVDGNESLYSAVQKDVGIGFKQCGVVTVGNDEKEKILLPQVSFYAANDGRTIKVTDLLGNHADHVGAFHSQIAGIETGAVIQLARGGEDSLLGVCREQTARPGSYSAPPNRSPW